MEELERKTEVVEVNGETVTFRTTLIERHTLSEALSNLTKHESNIPQLEKNIDGLNKFVEEQLWKPELEKMETQLNRTKELVGLFKKALEPYCDHLLEEGRKHLTRLKAEKHYDRQPAESKTACSVAILNETRAALGIDDIAHPVIQQLRKELNGG